MDELATKEAFTGHIIWITAEMTAYRLTLLGLCDTRWTETGGVKLASREKIIIIRAHRGNCSAHSGVAIMQ